MNLPSMWGLTSCIEIILIDGLDFARDLQRDSSFLCNFDGNVRAFDRRDASQEAEIILLPFLQAVRLQVDAMMNASACAACSRAGAESR